MPKGNVVGVDLNIDPEYLKSAVEDIVRSSFVQALGEPASIVKSAVDMVVNQPVDSKGNPVDSRYNSSTPYLQWLAERTI